MHPNRENIFEILLYLSMKLQAYQSVYLTELNIEVRVRSVVTQRTILPGTTSLGTRKEIQATTTNIMLGMYVNVR